jgi:hypothetical protein
MLPVEIEAVPKAFSFRIEVALIILVSLYLDRHDVSYSDAIPAE